MRTRDSWPFSSSISRASDSTVCVSLQLVIYMCYSKFGEHLRGRRGSPILDLWLAKLSAKELEEWSVRVLAAKSIESLLK